MSLHISIIPGVTPEPPPPPGSDPLYWIAHDTCRYDYDDRGRVHSLGWAFNPSGNGLARLVARETGSSKPEVFWINPEHSFRLSAPWVDTLCQINPELSRDKTETILGEGLAFCNGRWGTFDKARLMGGAVVKGTVGYSVRQAFTDGLRLVRGVLQMKTSFMAARASFAALSQNNVLLVDTLRADQSPPSAASILADPSKWFWCTGVRPDGNINVWWRRGLDGTMKMVRMFVISAAQLYISLDEVHLLPPGFVPDPWWKPAPQ